MRDGLEARIEESRPCHGQMGAGGDSRCFVLDEVLN